MSKTPQPLSLENDLRLKKANVHSFPGIPKLLLSKPNQTPLQTTTKIPYINRNKYSLLCVIQRWRSIDLHIIPTSVWLQDWLNFGSISRDPAAQQDMQDILLKSVIDEDATYALMQDDAVSCNESQVKHIRRPLRCTGIIDVQSTSCMDELYGRSNHGFLDLNQ